MNSMEVIFNDDGYYLEIFGGFDNIEYWAEFPNAPEVKESEP